MPRKSERGNSCAEEIWGREVQVNIGKLLKVTQDLTGLKLVKLDFKWWETRHDEKLDKGSLRKILIDRKQVDIWKWTDCWCFMWEGKSGWKIQIKFEKWFHVKDAKLLTLRTILSNGVQKCWVVGFYMCEKLGGAVGKSTKDPGNDFFRFMGFLGMTCTGFPSAKALV